MKKCPNALCGRVGDEIGHCGSFLTCPKASTPVEATDVVLHCDVCEITRAIPAASIIRGRGLSEVHMCLQEECACRPVSTIAPKPAPAKGPASSGIVNKEEG